MNPGLKQRLVGAVVLIALAVIFLPMLLPGNGGSTMPLFNSNVPDTPATRFEPIEIPLQLPPASPSKEVSVVDQPQPGDVASKEKPQQPPLVAPAPATTASSPSATVQKPVSHAKPPVPSQPVAAAKPVSSTPGEAWDVQLGSFSSSVNALALQGKVRKAGFPAFVEKVKSEQGTNYRVRVGPESSHERADALRERVKGKLKLDGIVVSHRQ